MKTKNKKQYDDESVLSKNHGNKIKYRIRTVKAKEAEEEIKDYVAETQREFKRVP